jgi:hypothetical protein
LSQTIPVADPAISTTPTTAVGRLSQRAASRTVLSWPTIAFFDRPARSAISVMMSSSRRSSSDACNSVVASTACPPVNWVEASMRASRSSPESAAALICSRSCGSRSGPSRSRMASSARAGSIAASSIIGIVSGTVPAARRSANASTTAR